MEKHKINWPVAAPMFILLVVSLTAAIGYDASRVQSLPLPTSHSLSQSEQSLTFSPADGWVLEQVAGGEDAPVLPLLDAAAQTADVDLSDLTVGKAVEFHLLCQKDGAEAYTVYSLVLEDANTLKVRFWPGGAENGIFGFVDRYKL